VFHDLKFGNIEEHRSANYWGEQYFIAYAGDLSLTVALADESGFEDYDYWISIKPAEHGRGSIQANVIGDELARRLTVNGFEVARPYSQEDWLFRKPIVRRIVYRKKPTTADEGAETGGQVETAVEEIPVAS